MAKKDLDENPKAKVCIGLNYSISIELIAQALREYGVLILRGKVAGDKRKPIIDKFNEPNSECRVLVANMKIVNCGVNLDDRDGEYPRSVYGSASYFFIECHQFPGRFVRGKETKSDVKFRFVYGKVSRIEKSILRALDSHTDVCLRTLRKQVENGVKFPGEYEDELVDNKECNIYYDVAEIIKSLKDNKDKIEIYEPPPSFIAKKRKEERNVLKADDSSDDEQEVLVKSTRPPPTIIEFSSKSNRY